LICEIGRGRAKLEAAFPRLPFLWLDTELSEGEVFWIAGWELASNLLPRHTGEAGRGKGSARLGNSDLKSSRSRLRLSPSRPPPQDGGGG